MIANISDLVPSHMWTISLLHDRPEEFILTGSRFFRQKEVSPTTDYDFIVLAGEGTIAALEAMYFSTNRDSNYRALKKTGATVYTRHHDYPKNGLVFKVNVDVQVYSDPELFGAKERAQYEIYANEPYFLKMTKDEQSDIWEKYINQALMGHWSSL